MAGRENWREEVDKKFPNNSYPPAIAHVLNNAPKRPENAKGEPYGTLVGTLRERLRGLGSLDPKMSLDKYHVLISETIRELMWIESQQNEKPPREERHDPSLVNGSSGPSSRQPIPAEVQRASVPATNLRTMPRQGGTQGARLLVAHQQMQGAARLVNKVVQDATPQPSPGSSAQAGQRPQPGEPHRKCGNCRKDCPESTVVLHEDYPVCQGCQDQVGARPSQGCLESTGGRSLLAPLPTIQAPKTRASRLNWMGTDAFYGRNTLGAIAAANQAATLTGPNNAQLGLTSRGFRGIGPKVQQQQRAQPQQRAQVQTRSQQQQQQGQQQPQPKVLVPPNRRTSDDDFKPPAPRAGAAGQQRGARRSAPPALEKGPSQEPIDLAASSDEEGGAAGGGEEAAGPGPSSMAAAAAAATGGVTTRRGARTTPPDYRSLAGKLAGLKCTYPKDGGKHSVEVVAEDLARLEKGEFLNDTCIDFYIKYIELQLPEGLRSRYHFFNTFFLKKLQEKPPPGAQRPKGQEKGRNDHERVMKWTKGVDLFAKDYVFVPIHDINHWSVVLICHPGNVRFGSKNEGGPAGNPMMLHLDSLDGTHAPAQIFKTLRIYLNNEWERLAQDATRETVPRQWQGDTPRFTNTSLPGLSLTDRLPQQNNYHDCGLFLLAYIEFLTVANPQYFVRQDSNASGVHAIEPQTDAADEKTFLKKEWFNEANTARLRDYLRCLICGLMMDRMTPEDLRWDTVKGVVDEYDKQAAVMGARYLRPVEYLKYVKENPHEANATCNDVLSDNSAGDQGHMEKPEDVHNPSQRMTRAAARNAGIKPTDAGPVQVAGGARRRKADGLGAGGSRRPAGGQSVVDLAGSPDAKAPEEKPQSQQETQQTRNGDQHMMTVDSEDADEQGGSGGGCGAGGGGGGKAGSAGAMRDGNEEAAARVVSLDSTGDVIMQDVDVAAAAAAAGGGTVGTDDGAEGRRDKRAKLAGGTVDAAPAAGTDSLSAPAPTGTALPSGDARPGGLAQSDAGPVQADGRNNGSDNDDANTEPPPRKPGRRPDRPPRKRQQATAPVPSAVAPGGAAKAHGPAPLPPQGQGHEDGAAPLSTDDDDPETLPGPCPAVEGAAPMVPAAAGALGVSGAGAAVGESTRRPKPSAGKQCSKIKKAPAQAPGGHVLTAAASAATDDDSGDPPRLQETIQAIRHGGDRGRGHRAMAESDQDGDSEKEREEGEFEDAGEALGHDGQGCGGGQGGSAGAAGGGRAPQQLASKRKHIHFDDEGMKHEKVQVEAVFLDESNGPGSGDRHLSSHQASHPETTALLSTRASEPKRHKHHHHQVPTALKQQQQLHAATTYAAPLTAAGTARVDMQPLGSPDRIQPFRAVCNAKGLVYCEDGMEMVPESPLEASQASPGGLVGTTQQKLAVLERSGPGSWGSTDGPPPRPPPQVRNGECCSRLVANEASAMERQQPEERGSVMDGLQPAELGAAFRPGLAGMAGGPASGAAVDAPVQPAFLFQAFPLGYGTAQHHDHRHHHHHRGKRRSRHPERSDPELLQSQGQGKIQDPEGCQAAASKTHRRHAGDPGVGRSASQDSPPCTGTAATTASMPPETAPSPEAADAAPQDAPCLAPQAVANRNMANAAKEARTTWLCVLEPRGMAAEVVRSYFPRATGAMNPLHGSVVDPGGHAANSVRRGLGNRSTSQAATPDTAADAGGYGGSKGGHASPGQECRGSLTVKASVGGAGGLGKGLAGGSQTRAPQPFAAILVGCVTGLGGDQESAKFATTSTSGEPLPGLTRLGSLRDAPAYRSGSAGPPQQPSQAVQGQRQVDRIKALLSTCAGHMATPAGNGSQCNRAPTPVAASVSKPPGSASQQAVPQPPGRTTPKFQPPPAGDSDGEHPSGPPTETRQPGIPQGQQAGIMPREQEPSLQQQPQRQMQKPAQGAEPLPSQHIPGAGARADPKQSDAGGGRFARQRLAKHTPSTASQPAPPRQPLPQANAQSAQRPTAAREAKAAPSTAPSLDACVPAQHHYQQQQQHFIGSQHGRPQLAPGAQQGGSSQPEPQGSQLQLLMQEGSGAARGLAPQSPSQAGGGSAHEVIEVEDDEVERPLQSQSLMASEDAHGGRRPAQPRPGMERSRDQPHAVGQPESAAAAAAVADSGGEEYEEKSHVAEEGSAAPEHDVDDFLLPDTRQSLFKGGGRRGGAGAGPSNMRPASTAAGGTAATRAAGDYVDAIFIEDSDGGEDSVDGDGTSSNVEDDAVRVQPDQGRSTGSAAAAAGAGAAGSCPKAPKLEVSRAAGPNGTAAGISAGALLRRAPAPPQQQQQTERQGGVGRDSYDYVDSDDNCNIGSVEGEHGHAALQDQGGIIEDSGDEVEEKGDEDYSPSVHGGGGRASRGRPLQSRRSGKEAGGGTGKGRGGGPRDRRSSDGSAGKGSRQTKRGTGAAGRGRGSDPQQPQSQQRRKSGAVGGRGPGPIQQLLPFGSLPKADFPRRSKAITVDVFDD